jgi:hypothetical protein
VARPLTRAIAREVYDYDVAMPGIAFDSRHTSSKLNVALFADWVLDHALDDDEEDLSRHRG